MLLEAHVLMVAGRFQDAVRACTRLLQEDAEAAEGYLARGLSWCRRHESCEPSKGAAQPSMLRTFQRSAAQQSSHPQERSATL